MDEAVSEQGTGYSAVDARAMVDAVPLWYHTISLPHGVVTPGRFDLRPIVERMPWPEVRGKRCLDVGTYDGFLAFEMERRGAREVLALDIGDHTQWDWSYTWRRQGPEVLKEVAGPDKSAGFRTAHALLDSSVERVECNAYELDPERIGTFDVVVCGSLLLHLRDPIRALEAMRSVCSGRLLSAEEVRVGLSVLASRHPVAELDGVSMLGQWWVPNVAGHRKMLTAAGFTVEEKGTRYAIPYGVAHPRPRWRDLVKQLTLEAGFGWGLGVPTHAVLARPT